MPNDPRAEELRTEIKRLRERILGLSLAQLHERGRRDVIRAALDEFSRIGSDGRPVPVLGDYALADQVTVLLRECLVAGTLGLAQAAEAATRLRRDLA